MNLKDVEKLAKEMTELCMQPVDEAKLASPEGQAILAAVEAAILHGKPQKPAPTLTTEVQPVKLEHQSEIAKLAKEMTELCMQPVDDAKLASPEGQAILAAVEAAILYEKPQKPARSEGSDGSRVEAT